MIPLNTGAGLVYIQHGRGLGELAYRDCVLAVAKKTEICPNLTPHQASGERRLKITRPV